MLPVVPQLLSTPDKTVESTEAIHKTGTPQTDERKRGWSRPQVEGEKQLVPEPTVPAPGAAVKADLVGKLLSGRHLALSDWMANTTPALQCRGPRWQPCIFFPGTPFGYSLPERLERVFSCQRAVDYPCASLRKGLSQTERRGVSHRCCPPAGP